jgi:hypothetical protein
MKKIEVAKEWIKETEKKKEKERREIELEYAFRREFGFSPDKIIWDGDTVCAIGREGLVTFSATEIYSGKTSDWKLREFNNCYCWEKRDGSFLYCVTILKGEGTIELYD